MRVKPFAALRPPRRIVTEVAAPPYDVINSSEALGLAGEKSLLHITKPEIDFDPILPDNDPRVYEKAICNFALWQQMGYLVRDSKPCYYVYAQTMGDRTQYGFVLCAHCQDYLDGRIKKHELTRKDKEDDRMVHVDIQNANIEPVFFAFRHQAELERILEDVVAGKCEYDFTDENGFGHKFWVISDDALIERITELFEHQVDAFYIADGHHRSAAAARVGQERARRNPAHRGDEEYNYFMAVCFPDDQLKVLDYNRVVKDLNGYEPTQIIGLLGEHFDIMCRGTEIYAPQELHTFSMYMDGKWYELRARPDIYHDEDLVGKLDVSILSRYVLDRILGLKDLRRDPRIDFVGGIRGLGELKRRVDSGEMQIAFALYPVTMEQIEDISDNDFIMPPKTTWFEPKLRSGLAIHTF
jgi:uncharacterized protein (DUF1015 family)